MGAGLALRVVMRIAATEGTRVIRRIARAILEMSPLARWDDRAGFVVETVEREVRDFRTDETLDVAHVFHVFRSREHEGVADGHGAEMLRPAEQFTLPPARRRAMLLKLVRLGADRVHQLMDPLTTEDRGPR